MIEYITIFIWGTTVAIHLFSQKYTLHYKMKVADWTNYRNVAVIFKIKVYFLFTQCVKIICYITEAFEKEVHDRWENSKWQVNEFSLRFVANTRSI